MNHPFSLVYTRAYDVLTIPPYAKSSVLKSTGPSKNIRRLVTIRDALVLHLPR